MLNLDPSTLLIIAIVAVILLGPDRLPGFARQVGGAWRTFAAYRHKMEQEMRSSMPDLPTSAEIARLARSPSALLDRLSALPPDSAAATPRDQSGMDASAPSAPDHVAVQLPKTPVPVPEPAPSPPWDPGLN
jgi:sec-independent protein translocase protein TatB